MAHTVLTRLTKTQKPADANRAWHAPVAILAACLAYGAFEFATAPAEPIMGGDAYAFLIFFPSRPSGYPLALWALGTKTTVLLQPLVYAAALAWLTLEVLAWTRVRWLAATVILCLAANPALNKWHDVVMSESLFLTLQLCVLAASVRCMRLGDIASLAYLSMLVGAVAIVRQAGLFFVIVPVVVAFASFRRDRLAAALIAALLPALLIVAVERGASGLWRGQAMFSSQLSEHLYSQGALIDSPVEAASVARFAPIRALIRDAPNADARQTLAIEYVNCVQHACSDQFAIPQEEKRRVGLARILAAPRAYAVLLWLQYRGLWAVYSQQQPALAADLKAYIDAHRPLPFEKLVAPLMAKGPSPFLCQYAAVIRPAIIAVGVATGAMAIFGWLLILVRKADDVFLLGVLCASGAHMALLFSAVFGGGAPRYTASMWPALMLSLLLVAASALRRLQAGRTKGRDGAGDRDRTDDIQLGKLTFYH
jgi:hypothetical protein